MNSTKVKLFIGSGEQSLLERKVLIYSIQKHTQRNLDIYVFNGTHNAIETSDGAPAPAPLPLHLKYRNLTEFSLYRYLIPELCSFEGRAIYLDSDMVCLRDIGELFDSSIDGHDFLAKQAYADQDGDKMWALSALLIDCQRCRFDLDAIFAEIDQGLYTYTEFSQMGKRFLARRPYRIGAIDSEWNVFDHCNGKTKLVHYTNQSTQPWKYPDHPWGEVWFSYLWDALAAGWVTEGDIELAMQRGYARPDLRGGNSPHRVGRLKAFLRRRRKAHQVSR